MGDIVVRSPYPVNEALCVLPNGGEAQYESFQSIFAEIMFAQYGAKGLPESPYEILCRKRGISLIASARAPPPQANPIIFFNPAGTTHYKALVNGGVLDPYDSLQPRGTQGFCQMFAFFLATGDMAGFIPAVQGPRVDIPNFNSLAHNSSVCFTKAIALIGADPEVVSRFTEYFDNIMRTNRVAKGIKAGTTISQYITDFTAINSSGPFVKAYIYDQPLVGWRTGAPKQELWDSFTQGGGSYRKKQKRKTSRRISKKHRRSHR